MFTFEEKAEQIKKRVRATVDSRWNLFAIASWYDREDVRSEVLHHIYKNWHLWDQTRPLDAWVIIVTRNKMINISHHHYDRFKRPCLNCPFYQKEGKECGFTKSELPDESCDKFARWLDKRSSAMDIRMPLAQDNHLYEIDQEHRHEHDDLELNIKDFNKRFEKYLEPGHYRIFKILFLSNYDYEKNTKDFETIIGLLNYKALKKREARAQIEKWEEFLKSKAAEMLQKEI